MLCLRPTPLNRRPTVQNLPNPHRAPSRAAGLFVDKLPPLPAYKPVARRSASLIRSCQPGPSS